MTQADHQDISEADIEAGKAMALLSWLSMFVGLPLFIVPLIQRDNPFALYHAKHAAMTFLASMVFTVVFMVVFMVVYLVTCGLGIVIAPLLLLTLVPTIDGLIKAMGGRVEPPLGVGRYTDQVFGGLTLISPKVTDPSAAPDTSDTPDDPPTTS